VAAALSSAQSGSLIVAAISAVFTIGYVANLLGEDEDWLFDLSIGMEPEDGSLWVYGVGEDGVPAFTRDGIDNLRDIIAEERVGREERVSGRFQPIWSGGGAGKSARIRAHKSLASQRRRREKL
jgi:hypothetical protein